MKNNKGFTLVELLAVIVLIAVLSIVAVSTYRGINESSKQKTLDAKIEQITSAAEKWARENNITTKTTLSVNTLVVEGYITADSAGTDGLAMLKNPVTAENMICNVVEINFKDGVIQTKFNGSVQNCKLASQSLVDSNISIRVITATNKDLTGTGSISKWTNEDIEVIVNSTEYDPKTVSISYDFEGSTKTKDKDSLSKYTGTTYVTNPDDYYNVYYIKSELLLNSKIVVTYDIPGEGTKSRAYTIRFDKEEATAILKSNSEWLTSDSKAQITVDDGKGSGPAAIHISADDNYAHAERKIANPKVNITGLQVGKYYLWTEDNAGNISHTYKMILEINNVDDSIPACDVSFEGHPGNNGWYKEVPVTPHAENTEPAGISGVNIGVNDNRNNPVYTGYAAYGTKTNVTSAVRDTETTRDGVDYYCHVKTLAGTYRQASQNLKLDMTPPTLTIDVTSDTTYTQTKLLGLTFHDELSGIPKTTQIKYGWGLNGEEPESWERPTTLSVADSFIGDTGNYTLAIYGKEITGTYYLYLDYSGITDYAGNHAVDINGRGSGGIAVFGPFMFDNTPPVCDGVGGKTNWTNGTYTVLQSCKDDAGTTDQSGCKENSFAKAYTLAQNVKTDTITIEDNAGNTSVCPINVYLEHIAPSCELHEPAGGPDGSNGWYKSSSVTITGTFQDNGDTEIQSGVDVFGTAKLPNSIAGATSVTFSENGASLVAWCYVRDRAGNEGANSLTFKKDDASYAGGCETTGGNTTWANLAGVPYQTRITTPPISGCVEENGAVFGYNYTFTSDCVYLDTFPVPNNSSYKTFGNHSTTMVFLSGSGVPLSCPYQVNVYSDRIDPVCNFTKTSTGTTAGVSVNVTCEEGIGMAGEWVQSNCVSSGDDQGSYSGLTSSTNYTVKDNAGNSNTCTVPVTAQKQQRTATCSYGYRCQSAGCESSYSVLYCVAAQSEYCPDFDSNFASERIWDYYVGSSTGCPIVGGSMLGVRSYAYERCYYCSYYYRSIATCGCESWNDWSGWTNVTSCTPGESSDHSSKTECRTIYN